MNPTTFYSKFFFSNGTTIKQICDEIKKSQKLQEDDAKLFSEILFKDKILLEKIIILLSQYDEKDINLYIQALVNIFIAQEVPIKNFIETSTTLYFTQEDGRIVSIINNFFAGACFSFCSSFASNHLSEFLKRVLTNPQDPSSQSNQNLISHTEVLFDCFLKGLKYCPKPILKAAQSFYEQFRRKKKRRK